MADTTTIAGRVLDALVTAGLLTADQAVAAAAETDVGQSLIARGLITPVQLGNVLEEELGIPRVDLASYAPDDEALELIPADMARERGILPLFEIEGMLTVAIGDPVDVFALDQLAAELNCEIEAVLAEAPSVASAIEQYYGGAQAAAESATPPAPIAEAEPEGEAELSAADFFDVGAEGPVVSDAPVAPVAEEAAAPVAEQRIEEIVEAAAPEGEATVDLDVLAVADDRNVAVLVTDILEKAVARGASRIHILPYKNDFFVVFRVAGRLEKVASAPLSMQPPLIDGFKHFAKLSSVPASLPALGRVRAEFAGRQLVLTVSSVPTVAGQRLVVSIAGEREPRDLAGLGMNEAEIRALHAMVERGRGMLLVAAPVAGGRSSTYYALIAHAAAVGKTVYSVERAIEYEIPAAAQVLVNPGSSVPSASYLAAGMRQDTDVIAIDSMQTVEDVHLAIEAAGLGKLVIATFAGADIATAVRRMLDIGAEPVSLASALTLAVGQRVVRTTCPSCGVEERSELLAMLPGVPSTATARRGAGCPTCYNSGFVGATGIFEVLPFTEAVRAAVAHDKSASEIAATAIAAGMRPMLASGTAKVMDGFVSPEELDRVLRFSTQ